MLDCKQTSQLISQSLDRSLTLRERFALKLHLFICKKCTQFSQHLQTLRVALKTMVSSIESNNSIEMSSATKQRISTYLEGKI
ncbi:MAG: zf-HC2 domain-containing protein [Bdellovibrio sp.]|nr:zf-HC2 domain-containing protein [Methylotenera sp.]